MDYSEWKWKRLQLPPAYQGSPEKATEWELLEAGRTEQQLRIELLRKQLADSVTQGIAANAVALGVEQIEPADTPRSHVPRRNTKRGRKTTGMSDQTRKRYEKWEQMGSAGQSHESIAVTCKVERSTVSNGIMKLRRERETENRQSATRRKAR